MDWHCAQLLERRDWDSMHSIYMRRMRVNAQVLWRYYVTRKLSPIRLYVNVKGPQGTTHT